MNCQWDLRDRGFDTLLFWLLMLLHPLRKHWKKRVEVNWVAWCGRESIELWVLVRHLSMLCWQLGRICGCRDRSQMWSLLVLKGVLLRKEALWGTTKWRNGIWGDGHLEVGRKPKGQQESNWLSERGEMPGKGRKRQQAQQEFHFLLGWGVGCFTWPTVSSLCVIWIPFFSTFKPLILLPL